MTSNVLNKRKSRYKCRRNGAVMAEFGAALIFILPLSLLVGVIAFQVSQVYMIKTTLEFAAQTAARRLAIKYGQNSEEAMAFPEQEFDKIRYLGVVKSSDQFSIPNGTAGWNTTSNPATVTVVVDFKGGKYGLDPFPNPDLLNLGSNFSISATGTCLLE